MSEIIQPAAPDDLWLSQYVGTGLLSAPTYAIDTPAVSIKLDQNESPWDWPEAVKRRITERLLERAWNRYPTAFADDIAHKVAAYVGVSPDSVLLGPGSNYLLSVMLTVLSKSYASPENLRSTHGTLVIARPSFPLYESHCRCENIPYKIWPLNAELDYDLNLMPELKPGSLVVFASPNNPVGNILPKATLAKLLADHPQTLFIADEAYFEYTTEPYTDLLGKFANLLIVRTFSKTLGFAGVRIGYLLGHASYLKLIGKLRLPYLLNHFALAAADVILSDNATKDYLENTRSNAIKQRQVVFEALHQLAERGPFSVKRSEANFLLVRWPTQEQAANAYRALIEAGILVRNVSGAPGLTGCLRITLGNEQENLALVEAFRKRIVGAA